MEEVIEFDQFKEVPERDPVFDRAIEVGDHPCSEGELDKFDMLLKTGRGEEKEVEFIFHPAHSAQERDTTHDSILYG